MVSDLEHSCNGSSRPRLLQIVATSLAVGLALTAVVLYLMIGVALAKDDDSCIYEDETGGVEAHFDGENTYARWWYNDPYQQFFGTFGGDEVPEICFSLP